MVRFKIFKDFKIRFYYYSYEPLKLINKFFVKSYFIDPEIRIKSRTKVNIFNFKIKNISNSFIINRCLITGRSKILNKYFRISRTEFRRLVKLGYIKGYKRSSW